MVILGGWVFLMSEVPLYPAAEERVAGEAHNHTVDYDLFIKSQLTRTQLTLRPYVVHILVRIGGQRNPRSPPRGVKTESVLTEIGPFPPPSGERDLY